MSDEQTPVSTGPVPTDDPGQSAAPAPQGTADGYSYVFPDGEKFEAKSREDFDKFFKGHYFRQKDYTQKTQAISQRMKEMEKKEADFQKQFEAFQKSRAQYDEWDKVLKTRPELYNQLSRMAQSPSSTTDAFERAKGYADEQVKTLKEELEALKKERETERTERELSEVIGTMKGKYRDFDEERVRQLLSELSDGNTEPLIRTLYFATRGMSPDLEKKVVETLERKRSAGMVPSGGATVGGNGKSFKNFDEAAQAAKREFGG